MIDETLLADPQRCPSCSAVLRDQPAACPACRLPLQGPVASRLWQVSVEAARLLGVRAQLVARLRAEADTPAYAGSLAPTPATTPSAGPAQAPPPQPPQPPAPPRPPVPAAPRPEWTPRRVQNLLLGLGVGLLAVAAVIFVAVSWDRLGVGGRAAVMAGLTAIAAAAAYRTARKGLASTAEALSLLTVGLALLDCYGARASDLAGLRDLDAELATGAAAGLVAAAAGAGSLVLRTRALRVSSAVLAQLVLPPVLAFGADRVDQPAALLAAGLVAQAVAALAVVAGWPFSARARDARRTVLVGGALAGVVGTWLAGGAAYAEDGSLVIGTALLLVAALTLAVASEVVRTRAAAAGPGALPALLPAALQAGAAAVLVAAVWAPVVDGTTDRWTAAALTAAAAVLLAAVALVPEDRRPAPVAVLLAAAVAPGGEALRALAPAVVGRAQWPDAAWAADGNPLARRLLAAPDLGDDGWVTGVGTRPALVLLLVVAAALVGASLLHARFRPGAVVGVPVVAAAGLLAAPALEASYAVGLTLDLAVALVALLAGVLLMRAARLALGVASLASGAGVLALGVAWSFAVDAATLTVLPVAAAVLVAAVSLAWPVPVLRAARVGALAAAVALLVGEAAAVARHGGAGWPAVWSLALALVVAAAVAAVVVVATRTAPGDAFWSGVLRGLVALAVAAAVADVGSLAWWQDAGVAGTGLAVDVAAAVLLAGSALVARRRPTEVLDARFVAGAGAAVGLVLAATDGDQLWLALLALGVGLAAVGVREDHRWGWPAGAFLAASSWVRLALSDVTAPEAYTVPPALALLALGLYRRHQDSAYPSWRAYGTGLTLALVPSLLRAVTDAGDLRPFLLGLAALTVLALGVARRLQAPLLLGGGVLAVDALVQLAPYLAAAYDVMPRWLTIGIVGLLLLASGARYEQRVRDLRRVGRHVARLG
ncbi:MAG TPA: hypothetical protein VFV76_15625 [Actinomycetes bacterium]|nr:hypothetical protein [Actinomycetes bacterium]